MTEPLSKENSFNWSYVSKYRSQLMGLIMLWIMLFHNRFQWTSEESIIYRIFRYGNVGVDIFVFLSGVGLYYSFSKNPKIVPFYKKRLSRLLIPYFLFSIPYYGWITQWQVPKLLNNLFQIEFIRKGSTTTWFVPWILCCYIVFPFIYMFIYNCKISAGNITVSRSNKTSILLFAYFLLLIFIRSQNAKLFNNIEIALTRGGIFIIGCYCAEWVKKGRQIPSGTILCCVLYIILYIWYITVEAKLGKLWTRISYIPFSLACLLAFTYVFYLFEKAGIMKPIKVFGKIGTITLELYLTHIMLRGIYNKVFGFPHIESTGIIDYLLVIVGAFIISFAGHWLIDKMIKAVGIGYKKISAWRNGHESG